MRVSTGLFCTTCYYSVHILCHRNTHLTFDGVSLFPYHPKHCIIQEIPNPLFPVWDVILPSQKKKGQLSFQAVLTMLTLLPFYTHHDLWLKAMNVLGQCGCASIPSWRLFPPEGCRELKCLEQSSPRSSSTAFLSYSQQTIQWTCI